MDWATPLDWASYYTIPTVATAFNHIGDIKREWGLLFTITVMPIVGITVPEIAKWPTGRLPPFTRHRAGELGYQFSYLIINATLVDFFFRGQNLVFGTEPTLGTVSAKTAVDYFLGQAKK